LVPIRVDDRRNLGFKVPSASPKCRYNPKSKMGKINLGNNTIGGDKDERRKMD
jgi:hypothetical protein